jgi:AraC-like DNA-binding protein
MDTAGNRKLDCEEWPQERAGELPSKMLEGVMRRFQSSGTDRFLANEESLRRLVKEPGTRQVFEQVPSSTLLPFVKRFLVVESPSRHSDVHLPDTRPVAAFTFRGRCRLDGDRWAPAAAFTGPREILRAHEHCEGHAVLLATFTAVGAAAFLRPPLEEFAGSTINLAGVLGRPEELDRLHEQLAGAPHHRRRIKLLENFLGTHIRVSAPDPLMTAAVDWLERDTEAKRIAELARYIGLSQSALERRFRRTLGISPKRFASIVRLRRAVRLRAGGADLTTISQAAGYFDQAHFIHDFRRATGRPPETFFRQVPAE